MAQATTTLTAPNRSRNSERIHFQALALKTADAAGRCSDRVKRDALTKAALRFWHQARAAS